jgi:hypothetical protein
MRRFLLILLLAFAARADEVLDNAAVVRLAQAGLSTDIILIKIEHSSTRFDTSTDALIALKAANVPDAVIRAMLLSKPASAPVPAAVLTPPAPPATDRCVNVTYYTLGTNGWAWTPASVCVSANEVAVNEQTIKASVVAAECFAKSSFLGDAEWWFTDGRESFKFRGKENELQDLENLLQRAAPAAKHGTCNDRKIAALFPK